MPEQQTEFIAHTLDTAQQHHNAGRLKEAESGYQQILRSKPNHPVAIHLLGVIALQVGKYDIAVDLITQAISIKPDYVEAYNNLGVALKELGRVDEVVENYQKAIAINPDYAEAHANLGDSYMDLGQLDEAVVSYQKALVLNPGLAEAHSNLGNAFRDLGELEKAVASYHRALAIQPEYAATHNNLGNALKDQGLLDEAVSCYHKAIDIKPDYANAYNNLGNALKNLDYPNEAVASYQKAIAIKPDYAEAYSNLGSVLLDQEKLDEAVACFEKAIAIKPDFAIAHSNLVGALEKGNRTEALREAVTVGKRKCPGYPRLSLGEAQLLKRDGNYAAARAALEAGGEPTEDANFLASRANLLGDLCDRLGDTEAAYHYFKVGNLQCKDSPKAKRTDGRRYLMRINNLEKLFTADWVAGWRQLESRDTRPDPIFLVGFPRSGTTLLDTILRSHHSISVVEEKPAVKKVTDALNQLPGGYPDALSGLHSDQLEELRQIYFTELDKYLMPEDHSSVVVDKFPLHIVEAGVIQRIFPQARFLFAQRHPCDCVLSCFMQYFKINESMINFLDLEDAAHLYDKVMSLWQQYQEVLPLSIHTIRYESLIEGFEETLTPLLDFVGVDWDDDLWEYAKTAHQRGNINTPSYNQVTKPLYTRARGRWERYRKHMQPVLPTLLPWAKRFGYDD